MNNQKKSLTGVGIKRLSQRDILPSSIKGRNIEGLIIFRGPVSERPSSGDTEIQVFFAEDENKLYIWNTTSEAWKSVTLS